MSYNARVFNVMIASPSDVEPERLIIREVIYDWNAVHSEEKSIVLLPVGWESHSSPEMGARPQEIINRQTLDKCDLLVGVFGTRIGSETGEYPSGTVEEIEEHIALGKPAMVYFSKRLENSDNFETEQYAKLEELKKDYESRGLYGTYDDNADFKNKFYRQLEIKVNEHEIFQFQSEEINSSIGLDESRNNIPQLSDEAQTLLKDVSRHNPGEVLYFVLNGVDIMRINGRDIITGHDPRVAAKWVAALQELVTVELLENADENNIFRITHHGYEVADMIEMPTEST